jgi:enoyl-[acyl-carrier-protein] reductase (NADH)
MVWQSSAGRCRHPARAARKIDEIAATCLFLVSDGGGFITGQTIHVNGGAGYY